MNHSLIIAAILFLGSLAGAVDVNPGTSEEPAKAEESLRQEQKAKKLSVEEKREELKRKHQQKKMKIEAQRQAAPSTEAPPVEQEKKVEAKMIKDLKQDVEREDRDRRGN